MITRICVGIFVLLLGLSEASIVSVSPLIIGIFGIIGGIAMLAGI